MEADYMIATMRIRKRKGKWVDHPIKIENAKEGTLSFDTRKMYPSGFTHYEILLNDKPVIQGKIIRVKKPRKINESVQTGTRSVAVPKTQQQRTRPDSE